MTFGEKVRAARLALNLSQAELAALTGITERSLYTYEQLNTLPRRGNLAKLAEALHVSAAYLTDETATDPQQDAEKEDFLAEVRSRFGSRGAREAEEVLARAGALFAGGDLDEEDKEVFARSLMQTYLASKEKASERFTPNARKKRGGAP